VVKNAENRLDELERRHGFSRAGGAQQTVEAASPLVRVITQEVSGSHDGPNIDDGRYVLVFIESALGLDCERAKNVELTEFPVPPRVSFVSSGQAKTAGRKPHIACRPPSTDGLECSRHAAIDHADGFVELMEEDSADQVGLDDEGKRSTGFTRSEDIVRGGPKLN
jgi:hypothetical protein